MKQKLTHCLHIFIFVNLAIVPLYELTAKYADFYVAHDSRPVDIFVLVLFFSFIGPGAVALILYLARRAWPTPGKYIHFLTIAVLLFITALPIFAKIFKSPDILIIIVAAVSTTIFTIAYARSLKLQSIISFAAPAIIVIPIIFLFFSPVRGVISFAKESEIETPAAGDFKNEIPIVMVIFDEFPLLSLLNSEGLIDKELFPNFHKFASQAHWFRSATTVSATTHYAVPAILTGLFPDEKKRIPNLKDYPKNLFTLLDAGYDFNINECCTQLSPFKTGESAQTGFLKRTAELLSDLYILYLHILAPPGLAKNLPAVNLTWEDFAADRPGEIDDNTSAIKRLNRFSEFIESISTKDGERTLNFIHAVFPHSPWVFYPSGRTYGGFGSGLRGITGLDQKQWWTDDEWPVIQAYQHHLLQVRYADKLVGRLIEKLKSDGLYERSLIILTADHGVSFRPKDHLRSITETNFTEILSIPLFLKEPFQKKGQISDRNVETIDILPTIIDILELRVAWKLDGVSALDPENRERTKKIAYNGPWVEGESNKRYEYAPGDIHNLEGIKRKLALFGSGPKGLYNPGTDKDLKELIGRSVEEFPSGILSKFRIDIDLNDLKTETGAKEKHLDFGIVIGQVLNIRSSPDSVIEGGVKIRLALSMDGKIEAITKTLEPEGDLAGFSFLIPEEAFTTKRKKLEIYEISGSGKDISLKTIVNTTYILETKNGKEVINIYGDRGKIEKTIKIDHNAMLGRLESIGIKEGGGQLFLSGWAADTRKARRPEKLLIFVKEKYLASTLTKYRNPDEAELRGAPKKSGFSFAIPVQIINRPGTSMTDIRIFAVSKDDRATELNYLHGFHGTPKLRIERTTSGKELIISASGAPFPIVSAAAGGVTGALSEVKDFEDVFIFSGWALDIENESFCEAILLFSGGKLINIARTSYYTEQLARDTGFKNALKSGFIFEIPKKVMPETKGVRLFAISKSGKAVELDYPKGF